MQIFLLTGGIGTGKSLATNHLSKHSIGIIDTDEIAKLITAKNGVAIPMLVDAFGVKILNEQQELNRAYMRSMVFNNPIVKLQLEEIMHPLIQVYAMQNAQHLQYIKPYLKYIFYVVPLFIGRNQAFWHSQVQKVITIESSYAIRVQRIMQRGLSQDIATKIIQQQPTNEEYREVADYMLENNTSYADFMSKLDSLHVTLKRKLHTAW
jgi:dephospho-CoA kinase